MKKTMAFTLVELMVMIAILGVLSALTVQAFATIQSQSRQAACLSNLRQIGVGIQLYALEHEQTLPVMQALRADKSEQVPVVDTVLVPYLQDSKVFVCPADQTNTLHEKSGTSYYWNSALNGQKTFDLHFLNLTTGSSIPVLGDKESFHQTGNQKVNVLYADGRSTKVLKFLQP